MKAYLFLGEIACSAAIVFFVRPSRVAGSPLSEAPSFRARGEEFIGLRSLLRSTIT